MHICCISIYKIYNKWVLVSLATLLLSATEGQKAFSGRMSRIASARWRNKDNAIISILVSLTVRPRERAVVFVRVRTYTTT